MSGKSKQNNDPSKPSREDTKLVIHGLWHDIASGELEMLDPSNSIFVKI